MIYVVTALVGLCCLGCVTALVLSVVTRPFISSTPPRPWLSATEKCPTEEPCRSIRVDVKLTWSWRRREKERRERGKRDGERKREERKKEGREREREKEERRNKMENPGFDPGTSRMLSGRSTN